MNQKNTLILVLIAAMMLLLGGLVAAQDDGTPPPDDTDRPGIGRFGEGGERGGRFGDREGRLGDLRERFGNRMQNLNGDLMLDVLASITEQTGLNLREVLEQVRGGQTLADVIEANGGDVQAVAATIVSDISANLDQRVAEGQIPAELAERVQGNLDQIVNNALSGGGQRMRNANVDPQQALTQAMSDTLGLDRRELFEQLRDGQTPAEVISANGGDVQAVVDSAIATSTERINAAVTNGVMTQEQADEMLAQLPEVYDQIVNEGFQGNMRDRLGERFQPGTERDILGQMSATLGVEPREFLQQLRDGATPADILSANGVDVNAFIDEQVARLGDGLEQRVENGRMTQEQADERLEQFRQRLTDAMNRTFPAQRDN